MSAPMDNRMQWTVHNEMRPATCAETGCLDYRNGWKIRINALSDPDLHAMRVSGRRYTVLDVAEGETYWVFEAGQPCFRASTHQAPVDKPELYLVRDRGDVRRYDRGDQFAEDLATHTNKIVSKIMEG